MLPELLSVGQVELIEAEFDGVDKLHSLVIDHVETPRVVGVFGVGQFQEYLLFVFEEVLFGGPEGEGFLQCFDVLRTWVDAEIPFSS